MPREQESLYASARAHACDGECCSFLWRERCDPLCQRAKSSAPCISCSFPTSESTLPPGRQCHKAGQATKLEEDKRQLQAMERKLEEEKRQAQTDLDEQKQQAQADLTLDRAHLFMDPTCHRSAAAARPRRGVERTASLQRPTMPPWH